MREISLIYKRFPNKISRISQELLFENSDSMVMKHQVKNQTPFRINDVVVIDEGYWAIWFVFWGKWHDIGKFYTPEYKFTGYYCDIITPMIRLKGSKELEFEITDLCLDLWISPEGDYTILDEDEFEAAVKKNWIEKAVSQKAKEELARLIAELKNGKFPPGFVKSYELFNRHDEEMRNGINK